MKTKILSYSGAEVTELLLTSGAGEVLARMSEMVLELRDIPGVSAKFQVTIEVDPSSISAVKKGDG